MWNPFRGKKTPAELFEEQSRLEEDRLEAEAARKGMSVLELLERRAFYKELNASLTKRP